MKLLKKYWYLPASGMLLSGCYADNEQDLYPITSCDTTQITYQVTIKPIITGNCAIGGCHDASSSSAGVNLSGYDGLKNIAGSGKLIGAINHQSGFSPMPKNAGKLSDCYITQISQWVLDGAPNN